MNKGIVYTIWDNYNKSQLQRSIDSIHGRYDYTVNDVTGKRGKGFQKRKGLLNSSPYDITLFLDIDTKVFGNIDFGFEMAFLHSIACCVAPADDAYAATGKNKRFKDLTQFNCGVLFVSKCERSFEVFRLFDLYLNSPNSANNDQPYFSKAMFDCCFNPYVLHKGWNYRPHLRFTGQLNGELKILHSGI